MTEWLRLWHDMPTDPKWRAIARKSGQPLPCVIALFNLLLVNASANAAERGTLSNWSDDDAAAALDMDEADVAAIIAAMEGKVISASRLTGWERRQPKREDGTAAERKAAWKERKNALERTGTHGNAPETETETETERKIPKPDGFGRAEPVAVPEVVSQSLPLEEPLPDPKRRLWGEAVPALVAMGVDEKQARPIIGRWLRDCGDDAMRVLDAIQRAREYAPMAPVPWITAGFTKAKSNRKASDERKAALQDAIGPTLYEVAAQRRRESANGFGCGPALALERPS